MKQQQKTWEQILREMDEGPHCNCATPIVEEMQERRKKNSEKEKEIKK